MAITYIPYNGIDKRKWDHCIANAANGLVYAGSVYLDCMAENWDGLVWNDYEAVMPLTWKKKFGIYYLYQPYFTSHLGLFGNNLSAELLDNFLAQIPAKFKYWDIYLNHSNLFSLDHYDLYQRMNYVLSLQPHYDALYAGFRESIKRNIKKAEKLGCTIQKNIPVEDVISLAKEQSKAFASITSNDFDRFKKLFHALLRQQQAVTYAVFSATKEMVASCVFFTDNKRAYYILVGNHPNGKTIGASHALINAFIKDYAGSDLLLDFEGSDIRNLAFFYSSFGAVEEKYPGLKKNKLPALLKWLKQ